MRPTRRLGLLIPALWGADAYGGKKHERAMNDMIIPLFPILFPAGRPEPTQAAGILMIYVKGGMYRVGAQSSSEEPEAVTAARVLRNIMTTGGPAIGPRGFARREVRRFPMTLVTDNHTVRSLGRSAQLWDSLVLLEFEAALRQLVARGYSGRGHGGLKAEATGPVEDNAYSRRGTNLLNTKNVSASLKAFFVWKLLALASSPYRTTVFLDNDVLVLSRTFVVDLLTRSLRVSDFAIGVDPSRPPVWSHQYQRRKDVYVRTGTTVGAPDMYGQGLPPLCSCVIAYRRTPSVEKLLLLAASRLLLYTNPFDHTVATRQRVRQSDQEMLWFQLAQGTPDPSLRLMVLPEEYYCPAYWPSAPRGRWREKAYFLNVAAIAAGRRPTWTTRWGEYDCHAVHFHHSHRHLTGAHPKLAPGAIRLFNERVGRGSSDRPACPADSPRTDLDPSPHLNCTHYAWGLAHAIEASSVNLFQATLQQRYNVTLFAANAK